ncbi:MAG: hypothetical protein ABGZ23_31345 [Fuerstiella sp.]|nr:hypothetical protein [Fuerstiella sp.]
MASTAATLYRQLSPTSREWAWREKAHILRAETLPDVPAHAAAKRSDARSGSLELQNSREFAEPAEGPCSLANGVPHPHEAVM